MFALVCRGTCGEYKLAELFCEQLFRPVPSPLPSSSTHTYVAGPYVHHHKESGGQTGGRRPLQWPSRQKKRNCLRTTIQSGVKTLFLRVRLQYVYAAAIYLS